MIGSVGTARGANPQKPQELTTKNPAGLVRGANRGGSDAGGLFKQMEEGEKAKRGTFRVRAE